MTIIHELAHAVSLSDATWIADLPNGATAYGWKNVIQKTASVASRNADNYAYFGLWAILADLGYSLPQLDQRGLSVEQRRQREVDIIEGALYYYSDITSRSLTAMLFSA